MAKTKTDTTKNLKPFKKGIDERRNMKGRPPRLLTHMIADLKAAGYEEVKALNVVEAYSTLFNLNDAQLRIINEDEKAPIILKIAAKGLLDKKSGRSAIELMLNRAHGTPKSNDTNNMAPTAIVWNETKTYEDSSKQKSK